MIPKVIHYCWFGRNSKPKLALRCIESWKRFFPDYEIKEWNENNFDVNISNYTAEAYKAKKYAFVSDYARFWILYNYGGLYFDTDVEVVKNMNDIIDQGPFMGIEVRSVNMDFPKINPGLGIGAIPKLDIYKQLLDYYKELHFIDKNGKLNQTTIVSHTTNVLIENGLKPNNNIQNISGIWIYPQDYFCPYNYTIGLLNLTDNTCSIHWYGTSWVSPYKRFSLKMGMYYRRLKRKFE